MSFLTDQELSELTPAEVMEPLKSPRKRRPNKLSATKRFFG
jgi:hypothetical protein